MCQIAYFPMIDSLAINAPLSDGFILLFRLGRANINWLDNLVVSISYKPMFSTIVSIFSEFE